eukprot:6673666-Prorocentrum_lima.AAC.1
MELLPDRQIASVRGREAPCASGSSPQVARHVIQRVVSEEVLHLVSPGLWYFNPWLGQDCAEETPMLLVQL